MPQLNQLGDVFFSQLFWLLLTLAILYFGIARTMVPKIQSTVDARHAQIEGDLAAAERAKEEAEAIEEAYRAKMEHGRADALELARAAKTRAGAETEKKLHAADAELAERTSAAEARLDADRVAAAGEIEKAAAEAVAEIVAKLTGMKVAKADAAAAVKTAMADG